MFEFRTGLPHALSFYRYPDGIGGGDDPRPVSDRGECDPPEAGCYRLRSVTSSFVAFITGVVGAIPRGALPASPLHAAKDHGAVNPPQA